MIFRLVWHGPVIDVEYDVQALTVEDAEHTLCAWLQGDDDIDEFVKQVKGN